MTRMTIGLVAGLVALGACGPVKRPDGGAGLLPVGAAAPDVEGIDATGHAVKLSSTRGHAAIVYFYPKDETPGCTTEACAFRDAFKRYQTAGVVIFGVSRDSVESHSQFASSHHLPFPLVSDESGALARAYGVSTPFGMASRVSFLVNGDGRIARVWPNVDPGIHADEVLGAALTLVADGGDGGGTAPDGGSATHDVKLDR